MTEPFRLIPGGAPGHEMADEMAERISAVVYDYAGRVPLALAVGVLQLVQREIIEDATE